MCDDHICWISRDSSIDEEVAAAAGGVEEVVDSDDVDTDLEGEEDVADDEMVDEDEDDLDEEDPEWMEDEDDPEYKPSADDWGESRCDRTPPVIKTPTTSDQHVQFCTRE